MSVTTPEIYNFVTSVSNVVYVFQMEFIPEDIKQVTPTGIDPVDSKHREFDMVVCAKGTSSLYLCMS